MLMFGLAGYVVTKNDSSQIDYKNVHNPIAVSLV